MRQRSDIRAHEQNVLSVLQRTRRPMSAYGILDALHGSPTRAAIQVYRSLERLAQQKRIHRIASLNAYVMCAHPEHDEPAGFFVCKSCGTATEFDLPVAAPWPGLAAGCQIDTISIELSGTCADCAARNGASA
ncbi:Fur family transcriptional regulator [Taklimakanibacter lacteus]|uniref:Fur family transcriptional regulator n=1 Tax=Taklimakanibacter lacteus TaxID=2268456 RepID=UPI0013C4059D